jgi:hypothetical protein
MLCSFFEWCSGNIKKPASIEKWIISMAGIDAIDTWEEQPCAGLLPGLSAKANDKIVKRLPLHELNLMPHGKSPIV